MTADKLMPGEHCQATGKGLHAKPRPGTVESVLDKRYMVLLDGETEAQPFSAKKVRRAAPAPKKAGSSNIQQRIDAEGVESVLGAHRAVFGSTAPDATLRDRRPPTRLKIPDANVPTIQLDEDRSLSRGLRTLLNLKPQPKPPKPSRSEEYLEHVRQHDCCNCGAPGPSDPDHVGERGIGQKCSDFLCIPLCRRCHSFRTDHNRLPEKLFEAGNPSRTVYQLVKRSIIDSDQIILRAQVQMLREWAEKQS